MSAYTYHKKTHLLKENNNLVKFQSLEFTQNQLSYACLLKRMGCEKADEILGLSDLDFGDFNYRVKREVNFLKRRFQSLFGWGFKLDEGFFYAGVRLKRTTIAGFQKDIVNACSLKDIGCTYHAGKSVKLDLRNLRVDYEVFHGSCLSNLK